MSGKRHVYEAWEERIMSEEKGNRIIHFYLRSTSASPLLAVVGTERSGRHFIYRVSKEFVETFGASPTINVHTKWTARPPVWNWLISLVTQDNLSPTKPDHCSSIKRLKSLEEDLLLRVPKKPRSSRVRQRQDIGSSDAIAASKPTGAQLLEPNSNKRTSFGVGDKIEILCQDNGILCQGSGMRCCWFRCKVVKISKNCVKVQYNDVENVTGSGKLEKWIAAPRFAPADELSLRHPGRLTIRPCPPEEEPPTSFEVGAAVDAWWSNGWWESFVLTGVSLSSSDNYHVFIPGQRRCLILDRKDLRVSKEWVDDTWVPIKSHPDVLSFLYSFIF